MNRNMLAEFKALGGSDNGFFDGVSGSLGPIVSRWHHDLTKYLDRHELRSDLILGDDGVYRTHSMFVQGGVQQFIHSLRGAGHYAGQTKASDRYDALAELLRRHGLVVLQDEMAEALSRLPAQSGRVRGKRVKVRMIVDALPPRGSLAIRAKVYFRFDQR